MKEYETIADLTSSKQSSTGLLLWCRENLLYYIVQADGYTATGDDITFSNGRVGKSIDIADASQIKTITGNVQDDLSSIISGGLPSQVGQAGEYLRTDGTNAYWDSVVGLGAIGKTPEEYGAVGDGVTDDTAALQAAIDAIKGSGALGLPTNYLVLEAKTYAHTGLVIDRAINIIGKDRNASRLKCLTTSAAAISVSLEYDTTNYQTAGRPGPTVAIKDCIIESDKGFAATNYGIRAFDATTNHIRGWIYLDGVDIHSMGGDALFANTWEGAIKAVNCKFINNAGKQINATSCADWQFIGCEFGVTPDDNILLSGCAAFTFTTCNIYSSTGDLVTLFTDAAATAPVNHQFVSCSFDRSSMGHGVIYNVRNDGNVTFTNCYWTYNGQGAPETYSDIWIDASVGRGPTIVGGWMQDPSVSDSLYNIFFNGTSSSCYTTGVQFEGGNARSTNVTNSLPQLKFEGAENFDTFTDLEASTWPEIGDEVKVVSGANAPFIIKDAGSYTALAGDRTLANGRVGALQVKGKYTPVENFENIQSALNRGVPLSLSSDISAANITVPSGAILMGVGRPTISLSDPLENTLNLEGGVRVYGIIFNMTGTTGADTFGTAAASCATNPSDTVFYDCDFYGQAKRPYLSFSVSERFDNLTVEKCSFVGPYDANEITSSFDGGGVRILADQLGNRNIRIDNNKFSRIASNSVQMRYAGGSIHTEGCFVNVSVSGNECFEPGYSSSSGHTWFETISIDNYTCDNNKLYFGGRGLSCGAVRGGSFKGNTLYNLYLYGVEMSTSDGVVFVGNTVTNCNNFISDNGSTGLTHSRNITIEGNTIVGGNTGLAGWNSPNTNNCIYTNSNDEGYKDWLIQGNSFRDWESGAEVIYVSGSSLTSGFTVKENTYTQRAEDAWPVFIKLRHGSNHTVSNNKIYRYSDISDTTGSGVFAFIGYQVNAGCDDIEISNNKIEFKGSDTRASTSNIDGISHNSAAGSLTNFVVSDNKISGEFTRPLNIVVNSGDTVVLDNDTRGATGSDSINSSVIYRRVKRTSHLSSVPTSGEWDRGDKVWATAPSASGQAGWICVSGGEFGSGTDPVFKAFATIQA